MDICSIIGRLVSGDKEADGTSTAPIRLIGSRRKLRWSVTEILFLTRIRLVWWSYTFESKKKLNCIRQTGFIVRWKIFMKLVPWWIFHLMKINERPSQWKGTQSGQIISGNPASYPDENPQYPTIPASSLDSSWSWNKSRRCLGWFYYSFEMNFIFCIFPFFKKMSLNGGNPIVSITHQRSL